MPLLRKKLIVPAASGAAHRPDSYRPAPDGREIRIPAVTTGVGNAIFGTRNTRSQL
jgi:hypothetical protein